MSEFFGIDRQEGSAERLNGTRWSSSGESILETMRRGIELARRDMMRPPQPMGPIVVNRETFEMFLRAGLIDEDGGLK